MLPTVFNLIDTATLLHARTSSLVDVVKENKSFVDVVKESKDIPCSLSC
jgi:hypothetical protein